MSSQIPAAIPTEKLNSSYRIDPPKLSVWNGREIELNPETKTTLKLTALALVVIGLGVGIVVFCPAALPLLFLGGIGLIVSGAGGLAAIAGKTARFLKDEKDKKDAIEQGLGDPRFFKLLFALGSVDESNILTQEPTVPLQIILDFFRSDPKYCEAYPQIIEKLQQALDRAQRLQLSQDFEGEAQRIHDELINNGIAQLASVSSETIGGHQVGIYFSQNPQNPNSVICSIFNSGSGLQHHFYAEKGDKHDLQVSWEIPLENFTPEFIKDLLDPSITMEDKYNKLAEGKKVSTWEKLARGDLVRLQKSQKSGNCTVEWIFAFLKYQMTHEEYYNMRQELFEKVLAEGEKNPETKKIIETNRKKVDSKIQRKQAKAAVAKEIVFPEPLQFSPEAIEKAWKEAGLPLEKHAFAKPTREQIWQFLDALKINLADYFAYDQEMRNQVEERQRLLAK